MEEGGGHISGEVFVTVTSNGAERSLLALPATGGSEREPGGIKSFGLCSDWTRAAVAHH